MATAEPITTVPAARHSARPASAVKPAPAPPDAGLRSRRSFPPLDDGDYPEGGCGATGANDAAGGSVLRLFAHDVGADQVPWARVCVLANVAIEAHPWAGRRCARCGATR